MHLLRWATILASSGSVALTAVLFADGARPRPALAAPLDTPVVTASDSTATVPVGAPLPAKSDSTAEAPILTADWRDAPEIPRPLPPLPEGPFEGYRRGEDPLWAEGAGWPVAGPEPLPGALLPHNRIVAYYGNPRSRRMGALGETDPVEMRRRLEEQVEAWREADPETPVVPALHLIAVVAQQDPGPNEEYRSIMPASLIEEIHGWAREMGAILFLDVQAGLGDLEALVHGLEPWLALPDVHLGVDPEFNMESGARPGTRIGTLGADEINRLSGWLEGLVVEHDLPPKVLVVHRFTQRMVGNATDIALRPEVQVVMHMDGWGEPWLKRATYHDVIVREPVEFAGFKVFYHNDSKGGEPVMTPADILRLRPIPLYIQYQ